MKNPAVKTNACLNPLKRRRYDAEKEIAYAYQWHSEQRIVELELKLHEKIAECEVRDIDLGLLY